MSAKTKTTMSPDEAAILRITSTAFDDEGYRRQLVNLADSRGGIYAAALEALYAIERQRLTPDKAVARVDRDQQLLREMRSAERRRRMLTDMNAAGELVEAAENTCRAIRDDHRDKLVAAALADEVCRQRLEQLADTKKGIYAEALTELQD